MSHSTDGLPVLLVHRFACIVRALQTGDWHRLTDIAYMAVLPKSTTRRLLKAMIKEKLVVQDEKTRCYTLVGMVQREEVS